MTNKQLRIIVPFITIPWVVRAIMFCGVSASASQPPSGLRCELLTAPETANIADRNPELSWIVNSSKTGDDQTSYRIIVASSRDNIENEIGDMWDSGKVDRAQSVGVEYSGKPLSHSSSYFWRVKTWLSQDKVSSWSAIQSFSTVDDETLLGQYLTTRYPLVRTENAPITVTKKGDGHYFVDFGKVAFGYLTLELDVPVEGHELDIHLAERGDENGVNRNPTGTVRYTEVKLPLKQGKHSYRVQTPIDSKNTGKKAIKLPSEIGVIMPFRYVEILNCPIELRASRVRQVAVHYPFDEDAASFQSSDKALNDIWELCKYSMKATSFCGVYVDGDRERIPYEADAYINQLSHYAVDSEYSIARYSHEYLLEHPTWPTEWKQHSVMMAWADYMYTGDKDSLINNYDILKRKKTLEFQAREDGLLNTKGLHDIVDWPKGERDNFDFKEVNTVVNSFYYLNLNQMEDMAQALGKDDEAILYKQKAAKMLAVFNEKLFDEQKGVYIDGEGSTHASIHANMFPLAFGMVPPEQMESVADFVVSRGMACSVYAAQYLMEGLYRAGRGQAALKLLTSKDIRSWYNMLRVGSTITLEAWDNKFKPNQDWNHAWGAVPGNIIPRYLLGVRPLEPGFSKVLVRPMPGSLAKATATIPTIRGPIKIKLANEKSKPFTLEIELPANMTARVEIPLPDTQNEIIVDSKKTRASVVNGFAVVDNLASGKHLFKTVLPAGK